MFSFYKIQVEGNDFVIINFLESRLDYSFKLLSKFLCDRHFGVGGDGTLILEQSEVANFKVRIFNKNGEELQMSGNGIICVAKYIYENKLIDKTEFEIETKSGVRKVKIEIIDSEIGEIEVDMGEVKLSLEDIPINYLEKDYYEMLCMENIELYPILIGELYVIIFTNEILKINIEKMVKLIEDYKCSLNKTNIVFAQIIDNENIKTRIWKRGIGEVLSSGTGASALAMISNKFKSTSRVITVNSIGGNLKVSCENNIKLKGKAENVFSGNIII